MGLDLEYDPATAIGQRLYFRGGFEQREIDFCTELLSQIPRPVVIDVGANIGVHSLYWAKHHEALNAHLFEPSKRTAEILRRNITKNGLEDRLTVHEIALSSSVGEAPFFECSDNAFSSLKDTGRKPVLSETRVPVHTLDQWVLANSISKIDLIKIDVEGLEHDVVLGASKVLKTLRPHLFVEIFGGRHSNPNPEATVRLIQGIGYEVSVFDGRNGLTSYSRHSDKHYNYYFAPT